METFKPIFDGVYKVSSYGRIRRVLLSGRSSASGFLKSRVDRYGYPRVNLSANGVRCTRTIHSLVAEAFLGIRPTGKTINHRDGRKKNNKISNLEYISMAENNAHAGRLGLKPRGEKHRRALLTNGQVLEIRHFIDKGIEGSTIARAFDVGTHIITQIKRRYTWRHI